MPTAIDVRLAIRNRWAELLDGVPAAWLDILRLEHAASAPGLRKHGFAALLALLRYRRLDPALATFRLPDAPAFRFVTADSVLVRRLFWYGLAGHEGAEVLLWTTACRRARSVLEIGANLGLYTVTGASAGAASYTAVEAHPGTAALLRANLALNQLDHVRVVEAAVVGCAAEPWMPLSVPAADRDVAPMGAFLADGGERRTPVAHTLDVPTVEARTLIDGVDLIKLDVEGYEHPVLSSIEERIFATRPTIFVELLPESTKLRAWAQRLCREHGYQAFACGPHGARALTPEALVHRWFGQRPGTRDVVLTVGGDWLTSAGDVPTAAHAGPKEMTH